MKTRVRPTTVSSEKRDLGETTVQVLLAVPIILSLVLMAVQGAVYMHAAHVASASAARGAAAGAAVNGGMIDAIDVAVRTAAELSAQFVEEPQATIASDTVTVTVTLRVPQVAPFFRLHVSRTAVEPRERFIPEDER